ncbi:uncharacterized protein LOC141938540 [Strix uralensis]|uniref:uncharacterized protein LOC141938540 n=1 Tax=Strix uralensis TaxID=36305 RepID=UPI003DA2C2A0
MAPGRLLPLLLLLPAAAAIEARPGPNGLPLLELCSLPRAVGRCRAAVPRWWFNLTAGSCQSFIFGGLRRERQQLPDGEGVSGELRPGSGSQDPPAPRRGRRPPPTPSTAPCRASPARVAPPSCAGSTARPTAPADSSSTAAAAEIKIITKTKRIASNAAAPSQTQPAPISAAISSPPKRWPWGPPGRPGGRFIGVRHQRHPQDVPGETGAAGGGRGPRRRQRTSHGQHLHPLRGGPPSLGTPPWRAGETPPPK